MAKRVYWGRFKRGRKWSPTWHRIPADSRDEAVGKFLKGTLYNASQIQIVISDPRK